MSGNPMYGWPSANNIGQWHQQAPPPPNTNTMHYGGSVPSVNNTMIGMPNSDTVQPSMQSVQPIHSIPSRQPHQNLQQQQMSRTSGLYQPMAATSPSQSQISQQNSQFQQHPQQSHYSQYAPSVLASQYWPSPMTQQAPLGSLPSSQTASSGFQQHHSLHQQSPTASPLQTVRGHPPTSHTPDRSNIPPSISANSSLQQTTSSFPNSMDIQVQDQQMIPSLSRQGLPQQQQQHPSGSMQMMQQNSSPSSMNNLPVSPSHGPTASQMRSMQQPQQPTTNWQQTNQYYQQPNQNRFPFAGSVNPYMPYGSASGTDVPNNIAGSTSQSASTRHMIGQKSSIDNNNDRSARGSSSAWPPGGNLYPQQQPSAQGGSNNNYYSHNYDSSSYYSMPGQSNMDSSQSHNNNTSSNIHQNQYWNTPLGHNQTSSPVSRPMNNNMHLNLVQQSPSASPLPHPVRNQPPSSQTPDRSPSISNIPPPSVPAPFPSPGQRSSTPAKNAGVSNSLAQLEQMVMPHLGGPGNMVKSPSHRSTTSSPILNSSSSTAGSMNQQLSYSSNYSAADPNSGPYFNSAGTGPSQQEHGYFPQYGTSSKTSSMWSEQSSNQTTAHGTAPGTSMMDSNSQYTQHNQYETQPNASYGEYNPSSIPTSSHEYSHIPQSETTTAPAPEATDPYAIDFQTFEDYDEQPSNLKSKKGRPKKGEGNEIKKERKPRAPRSSKAATASKGKKGKANAVPQEPPHIDPAMQPSQFESTEVINNDYNPPMINQEHYTTPHDQYSNSSHINNQPDSQSLYDQSSLSHLQPTTKPGDNQPLEAQQDYRPYNEYSQPSSKPPEPSESHQLSRDDNPINEPPITSSDKTGSSSFTDVVRNSHILENNGGESINTDNNQPILNSPTGKKTISESATQIIHGDGKNKQILAVTSADETCTLEAISSDSTISMSDNANLVSESTTIHIDQVERICDDASQEQSLKDKDQNLPQSETLPVLVMETNDQSTMYISSQSQSNTSQKPLHHSASSPSVHGPNLQQPTLPNQIISGSPPSHSPTRSMAISSMSPTSMQPQVQSFKNSSISLPDINDNVSHASQVTPQTSSGYVVNSQNQYHLQQQPVIESSRSDTSPTEILPCPNIVNQNVSVLAPPTFGSNKDSATLQDISTQEPQKLPDDPMSSFNGSQPIVPEQLDIKPKKSKNKKFKREKGSIDASNKRKNISRGSVTLDSSHEVATQDHTEKAADSITDESKAEGEFDESMNNLMDTESKPKPKRKRLSESNGDISPRRRKKLETDHESTAPVEQTIEESSKILDSSVEEGHRKLIATHNDNFVMTNKTDETSINKNESGSVTVASASKHNKHQIVVSPALSSSSTSTASLAKQDLSPSFSNADKPVICLMPGSNSVGTSSISPATKATSNGSTSGIISHKSSRRRSSERRESVREGLMRTNDFVIAKVELKNKHPHLWRINGQHDQAGLLQEFIPNEHDGLVLYENTHQYAGWNLDIKKDYVGVDVRLIQHSRSQIMVERLYLNLQTLNEAAQFYNYHFEVYVQILVSVCLDSQFWNGFENEPEKLDYFMASARVIDDVIQREKNKFLAKVKFKLDQNVMKCLDRYPNIISEQLEEDDKDQQCLACENAPCNLTISFTMESYDRDSLQVIQSLEPVETNKIGLCSSCEERVKLYSEMQHFKWKMYLKAREKVQSDRTSEKPISEILYECLHDNEWMSMMCDERDKLWDRVERVK